MAEERWTSITPSQYQHEREALQYVRDDFPDSEPYRAWSNFTFTAGTGHVYEVDLLLAAPSGLYLIEVKSWHGRLASSGANWIHFRPNGKSRPADNPLHLANTKAKQLKSLLSQAAAQRGLQGQIPFVQEIVFLSTGPKTTVELADHHLHHVYGTDGQTTLPEIWTDLLGKPPTDIQRRVTPAVSTKLPKLLKDIGIARSRRHFYVGSWELESRALDIGPTWQDHLAQHTVATAERRRVRLYLVERNADQAMRESIERAAKREMLTLHGINHPGIVRVDAMEHHDAGPALVFRHNPAAMRLDHYMAQYGDRLDLDVRLDMVRQLAEAIAYAHRRNLHHRALAARSVLVAPTRRRGRGEDAAWLRPKLQISDWQAATRGPDTAARSDTGDMLAAVRSSTSHAADHMESSARAYLAPELTAPSPDPVAMDVFGLGALAYLLFSGQPPAQNGGELSSRLAEGNGLRPSSVTDSVSEFTDELVQAATAPAPAQRLATVAEFVELLEVAEEDATTPDPAQSDNAATETSEPDPLGARPGDVVGGQWEITKRLGTGSTSRAYLATNLETGRDEVLKVALSDDKAARLEHEAKVLRALTGDSRVIRLARPEPLRAGGRTLIALDHAGQVTVARKLREHGRLTVDELETFSDYLLGAMDFLEGEGVTHRDIKPDNIAIRVRPNRTRQLVLFDFSLAGTSVQELEAGTPGYLDPFLGTAERQTYDAHAERYAVAVTLHQMASGELPVWGDGRTEARFTEGPPTLAAEAFDPAVRDGLVEFFHRALHRDAGQRFASLKEMTSVWRSVFHLSDSAPPVGSDHPGGDTASGELPPTDDTPEQARDAAARVATRATALDAAGLTRRAVSAASRLDATTVGDLLDLPSKALFNLPGLGAKTRQELQGRIREWRARLGERETPPPPGPERQKARENDTAAHGDASDAHARTGLDTVAALLVPKPQSNGRNSTEVAATRMLLGLPDESGALCPIPPWSVQQQVARSLQPQVSAGRIAQVLTKQRKRWRGEPLVRSVLDEVLTLLADNGRVMSTGELADAVLTRRGSSLTVPEARRALAAAAVRAAVEADPVRGDPRLLTRRHGERVLVALEATGDDAPDTPAGPALLDYADALGAVADRLAAQEVLPTPGAALRDLRAVAPPEGGAVLDDRRVVFLAAAASANAAATVRLEVYPGDLPPVRALRLTQAGLVPPGTRDDGEPVGLTPQQVRERVAARFPALAPLPDHPRLGRLLREAGFTLEWLGDRYATPRPAATSTGSAPHRRRTPSAPSTWTAQSPEVAAALRAEERLGATVSADTGTVGGFRALTVRTSRHERARRELRTWFGVEGANVATLFLDTLREQVTPGGRPTWGTLLRADGAEPGSRDAFKLGEYVAEAWRRVAARLAETHQGADAPLLLHDVAPLARYDAGNLLTDLAARARAGGAPVWLLCPTADPGQAPRLGATPVPVQAPNEWVELPDAWVAGRHRDGTGEAAS